MKTMYYLVYVEKDGCCRDGHQDVCFLMKSKDIKVLQDYLHDELVDALESNVPYINDCDCPDLDIYDIEDIEKPDYLECWGDMGDFRGYYILSEKDCPWPEPTSALKGEENNE